MNSLFPALGAAIALAGLDKLVGQRGHARMFGHLGWTDGRMEAVAVAEAAGGPLMRPGSTRRLGGAVTRRLRQGAVCSTGRMRISSTSTLGGCAKA